MRNILVLILTIFLSSFLQATIWPFNLVLLVVLSSAVLVSSRSGLIWAFLAGIVLDLATGQMLGFSSLIFLALAFLVNLYKSKFKAANFIYLLPFTFISAWFYYLLKGEALFVWSVVITTLLLIFIWPILNLIIEREDETGLQLPLKI